MTRIIMLSLMVVIGLTACSDTKQPQPTEEPTIVVPDGRSYTVSNDAGSTTNMVVLDGKLVPFDTLDNIIESEEIVIPVKVEDVDSLETMTEEVEQFPTRHSKLPISLQKCHFNVNGRLICPVNGK